MPQSIIQYHALSSPAYTRWARTQKPARCVVVCFIAFWQLCPLYAFDQGKSFFCCFALSVRVAKACVCADTFNEHNPPSDILKFEDSALHCLLLHQFSSFVVVAGFVEAVDVQNPGYDYLPPELVTLFITNLCVHSSSLRALRRY